MARILCPRPPSSPVHLMSISNSPVEKSLSKSDEDLEGKGSVVHSGNADSGHMHRSLKGRQVSMIAVAGTIGTGLFLGSGKALANGGPVGALLGYMIVGGLTGLMMQAPTLSLLGLPLTLRTFATRYVDPALGFAMGWQFWFQTAIGTPGEIVAGSILIFFWDDDSKHLAIYITVLLLGIIIVNFCGIKYFGEFEFVFASIKIMTVVGLLLLSLVIDLGGAPDHDRRGFRYWRDAPFNDDFAALKPPFEGSFSRLLGCPYSSSFLLTMQDAGMETLAMICLEAAKPRVSMRTAVRAIFYRIVGLYVLSILLIGMCISRSEPALLQANKESTGTASESPFVVVIISSGIKVLPHIINAIVLTSAFSAANETLYASSRSLFMLAQDGKAPRFFAKVNKRGVPVYSLALCSFFSLLAYLACGKSGAVDAFNWLSNIIALGSMITWCGISLSHIRWYRARKLQGLSRDELPFTSWTQPYGAHIVFVSFLIIIFFNGNSKLKFIPLFLGFTTFLGSFDAQSFVAAYINIPFMFILFIGYKIVKKTKVVPLATMDCGTHYIEDSVVYSKY
ncbi:AA-permease domain-containing protein [Mycena venus]|uniref:AA-permease domain-containing protein n=1 Tax=Mycena venus TaxID=2733690 RepID=A0A8H7CZZ5_9AGAR|nr:AA-permease domain-containing protein [Mycena venus]